MKQLTIEIIMVVTVAVAFIAIGVYIAMKLKEENIVAYKERYQPN